MFLGKVGQREFCNSRVSPAIEKQLVSDQPRSENLKNNTLAVIVNRK